MNIKKNNEEIILDNFLNSLYSIKDIYKLLYEIEKVLKLSVDYEVVKMICFGLYCPTSVEDKIIYKWLHLFQLCYSNRAYSIESNKRIFEFKKYDSPCFIEQILSDYFKEKNIFNKGVLLIYLSLYISKYYGISFRFFNYLFNSVDMDEKKLSTYLKGVLENIKFSSLTRLKCENVVEYLKNHNDFFKNENINTLYLFGSLVKNTNTLKSDIDLLVHFEENLSQFEKEIHYKNISELIRNDFHCSCDIVEEEPEFFDETPDALKTAIKIF